MFCINCGKEIPEGKVLCDACEAAQNQPAEEVVNTNAVPEILNQPELDAFELNDPTQKPAKKRGKGFPVAAVIAAVAVVAIVVTAVLCWGSIESFFIRQFGSPEDYLQHVTEKQMEANISSFSGAYGQILANMNGTAATATKAEMHLLLGDDLLDLLETAMSQGTGMDMDLSWLSDIMIDMQANYKDDLTQIDMGIGLEQTRILTMSMLMDMANMNMYVGLPELSDRFLSASMEGMEDVDMSAMPDYEAMLDEMLEFLPSEEYVNELLNRYLQIVLDNVTDVEKDTETVDVGDVEQKLNVLSANIYQEDLVNIAIAILEDAKDDKELLDLIIGLAEYGGAGQYDYVYNEEWDIYEQVPVEVDYEELITEAIDSALDSLDEMLDECDDDNYVTLTMYVDNSDAVCGMTLEVSGVPAEISYITVWEKNNFAFEAELGVVEIEGEGSRKKGLINGEYVISSTGMDILTVEVINYDEKKAEEGYPCGTIRLVPDSDIMDMMMGESQDSMVGSLIGYADLALQFDFNSSEQSSEVTVSIVVDDDTLLGLSVVSSIVDAGDIELPDDVVDPMDEEALREWLLSMDFQAVLDNLDDAGLPSEYLDILETYVEMLENGGYEAVPAPMY